MTNKARMLIAQIGRGSYQITNYAVLKNGGKWTEAVKMEGEVHDVLLYNGKRFAAFGERSLACFGMDGSLLWQKEMQREATVYPWWELSAPVPLSLRVVSPTVKSLASVMNLSGSTN